VTDIVISTATPDDWDAMNRVVYAAFHDEPSEEAAAAERQLIELERALVARRDGEVVGTAAIHTRQLAIPGGLVPAAHVTLVSVAPTARRQGVLTRFMRQQFDDARAAGEPIAVLWASERPHLPAVRIRLGSCEIGAQCRVQRGDANHAAAGGRTFA
jgi:predicted N-acetyltransferase YhbS